MTEGARRGATRGYVGALVAAAVIVALALVVAAWGLTALALARDPVESDVSTATAPLILLVAFGILAWGLWQQALVLLRGRRSPSWGIIVSLAAGAYIVWCLGGLLVGMNISETWLSPFAFLLMPIWALVSLLFWAVLARRVYTDRPPPRWPWERDGEDE